MEHLVIAPCDFQETLIVVEQQSKQSKRVVRAPIRWEPSETSLDEGSSDSEEEEEISSEGTAGSLVDWIDEHDHDGIDSEATVTDTNTDTLTDPDLDDVDTVSDASEFVIPLTEEMLNMSLAVQRPRRVIRPPNRWEESVSSLYEGDSESESEAESKGEDDAESEGSIKDWIAGNYEEPEEDVKHGIVEDWLENIEFESEEEAEEDVIEESETE